MKSDVLANTDLLFMPEITVVLFVSVFVGAMFWIFRPGAQRQYAANAQMPLSDQPIDALSVPAAVHASTTKHEGN